MQKPLYFSLCLVIMISNHNYSSPWSDETHFIALLASYHVHHGLFLTLVCFAVFAAEMLGSSDSAPLTHAD